MEEFISNFIGEIVKTGLINKIFVTVLLTIAASGIAFFYLGKLGIFLYEYFKKEEESNSQKAFDELRNILQKDQIYLVNSLEDVKEKLRLIEDKSEQGINLGKDIEHGVDKLTRVVDFINNSQIDLEKAAQLLEKDINGLTSDSKEQYAEISRHVQSLQKDLASLHGTIIGLNTQRPRLK